MIELPGILGTIADLLIVVIGFGLIVFVHELGHFIAARWAGIRVLTFAIGFGPALVSYRKGMGVRRGSSEAEYEAWLNREAAGVTSPEDRDRQREAISPTEYRLSALPLGGYVRMLGQEDLNPDAVSDASDSYQLCKPWKRMIVISAGVVMNVITAAVLFIAVFMIGIQVEPPRIGVIAPGSPAASATAVDGAERVGLEPGDTVLSVDGEVPHRFDAVMMAVAMSDPSTPTRLVVHREGVGDLTFDIEPEASEFTGLLDLGIGPAQTLTIESGLNETESELIAGALENAGLAGVTPGMSLRAIDGVEPRSVADLIDAFEQSGGTPVELAFEGDASGRTTVSLRAEPEFELAEAPLRSGNPGIYQHLLGLSGVMMVDPKAPPDRVAQGLKPGDIFERIGTAEYPSLPRGTDEIRSNAGRTIEVVVQRPKADGSFERVTLTPKVKRNGQIGFLSSDTMTVSNLLSLPLTGLSDLEGEPLPAQPAADVITRPGTRVVRVGDTETPTIAAVREALRAATSDAAQRGAGATLALGLTLPTPGAPDAVVSWELSADEVARLHDLGWDVPFSTALFAPERMILRAEGPIEAIGLGLEETKRVMLKTYLTFARLFQGSVRVEHLKGPVGIAHVGTRIASRGPVWLLFFMALISVNLAVINFLPLPIVDGGQFLMLVYEQFRGRPVPIPVQNAVTLAGLVLIGGVFLIVTFNDVRALLGL